MGQKLDISAAGEAAFIVRGEALTQGLRRDSCIATTWLVNDMLRFYGFKVEAFPVRVVAMNHEFAERWRANGHDWPDDDGVKKWTKAGAHCVAFGFGRDEEAAKDREGWDGHLVTLIDRQYLLDASIDQASRPDHRMEITRPIFGPITDSFLACKTAASFKGPHDVEVYYFATPENTGYLLAPDWSSNIPTHKRIVLEALVRIEAQLEQLARRKEVRAKK